MSKDTYHKIDTVFKRDPETKFKTLLLGEYSIPEFEYLADTDWVFTEKVDGTNIRVMFDGFCDMRFGGRTDRAQIPVRLMDKLKELFSTRIHKFSGKIRDSVCLYGEGYGDKIQKGGKYSSTQEFVLFDVKIGEWWLKRDDVESIAKDFSIDVVPIIGHGTLGDMVDMARSGLNSQWGNFLAEGIVARPKVELKARNGSRIITKIKCKDFNKE